MPIGPSQVVESNDKKRFVIDDATDPPRIRAAQVWNGDGSQSGWNENELGWLLFAEPDLKLKSKMKVTDMNTSILTYIFVMDLHVPSSPLDDSSPSPRTSLQGHSVVLEAPVLEPITRPEQVPLVRES